MRAESPSRSCSSMNTFITASHCARSPKVEGLGFMVSGSWFMVHGSWFMIYGLWFGV